jgi:hypothetical protein
MMFGLLATAPTADATLTNDFSALTEAGACKDVCPANIIHSFGDVAYGAPDIGNGFDSAESANVQNHFGAYARGSANSTADPGHGSGWAYGNFLISVLVPPQQGQPAGAPGTFVLPYHLDGTVTIDWAEVFAGGFLVSGANASLLWDVSSFNIDGSGSTLNRLANDHWSGNHLSATVNRNVAATIPFLFGEIFYISETYSLVVDGHSSEAPAVGFVEADFLHTAILGPATVKDGLGNVLVDPIVLSDTGFDFEHPSGDGGGAPSVPEPSSLLLLSIGLAGLAVIARRRAYRR